MLDTHTSLTNLLTWGRQPTPTGVGDTAQSGLTRVMLSTSFIVSASPVLTSPEPLYGNTQQRQQYPTTTEVDPYEAADHIYGLSSGSRRVKRSFSVGRSSDLELGRKTNNKR